MQKKKKNHRLNMNIAKKIKWCALQHIKWNYLQLVAHDDEKLKNRKKKS